MAAWRDLAATAATYAATVLGGIVALGFVVGDPGRAGSTPASSTRSVRPRRRVAELSYVDLQRREDTTRVTSCAATGRATTSTSCPTPPSRRSRADPRWPPVCRPTAGPSPTCPTRHGVQPARHRVRVRRRRPLDRPGRGRARWRPPGRARPAWSRSRPAPTSTCSATRARPAYAARTHPRSWPGSPHSRTPSTPTTSSTSTRTSSERARGQRLRV